MSGQTTTEIEGFSFFKQGILMFLLGLGVSVFFICRNLPPTLLLIISKVWFSSHGIILRKKNSVRVACVGVCMLLYSL